MTLAISAPARGDERRAVELVLAGSSERIGTLELALADPLGRLAVTVRIQHADRVDPRSVIDPGPVSADAFVRIWVDLALDNRVTLYFVDAGWERILIRKVPLTNGLDEVEREELAQIVRSAVEALLSGAKIGITREQARAELLPEPVPATPPPAIPPPAPAPARHPPTASRVVIAPGAFYEGQLYRDAIWQGPGLSLGVETGEKPALGGLLSLQYRAPMQLEGDVLGVRLQAFALRTLGLASVRIGGIRVSGAAGPGLDLTHVDPRRVADRGAPADPSWDVVAVLRALGSVALPISSLELAVFAGADGDVVQTRHVALRGGQEYTVFSAPRVRPFVGLGVSGR